MRLNQSHYQRAATRRSAATAVKQDQINGQIERINELSKMARGTWFSLLGYLAFVGVTLLAVEDADFFIEARKTDLPIVNVSIPTASFFIFGPILGTALFVYLHLYLIRLWDALSQAPAKIGDITLSEAVMPWLINDFALWFRNDGAFKLRPMDWLSHLVTILLVFIAAPFIMGYFWIRHFPSHDLWTSYTLAFLFCLTLITALASFFTARQRLQFKKPYQTGQHHIAFIPFACLIIITGFISFMKTEGADWVDKLVWAHTPFFWNIPQSNWLLATSADMAEVELIERPPDWQFYQDQRRAFRKQFCKSEGINPLACGNLPEESQSSFKVQKTAREEWAKNYNLDASERIAFFINFERKFEIASKLNYQASLAALPRLNLSKLDLRGANMSRAFFPYANLRSTKMQNTNLTYVQMQGVDFNSSNMRDANLNYSMMQSANFHKANMQKANISSTQTQYAIFSETDMRGANLSFSNMQNTVFSGAQMQGVNLQSTKMQKSDFFETNIQRANFFFAEVEYSDFENTHAINANFDSARMQNTRFKNANMQGTNLSFSKLLGADLSGANMQGTDIRFAEAQYVNWKDAKLHSLAHFADLTKSTNLTQEMLENVIGNPFTLLYASEGHDLYVWSCWMPDNLPDNIEYLLDQASSSDDEIEQLRAQWVCSDDNPRVKTGTMKPLDAE